MNGKWSVKHHKETSFSGLINRSNSDIKIMEDRFPCNSVWIKTSSSTIKLKICASPFEIKLTFQDSSLSLQQRNEILTRLNLYSFCHGWKYSKLFVSLFRGRRYPVWGGCEHPCAEFRTRPCSWSRRRRWVSTKHGTATGYTTLTFEIRPAMERGWLGFVAGKGEKVKRAKGISSSANNRAFKTRRENAHGRRISLLIE